MPWGSSDKVPSTSGGIGFGAARGSPDIPAPKPSIVFITNDERSRSFCHALCSHESLVFADVRIAHNTKIDALESLIRDTRLVVIATCRESLDTDSPAQEREKKAALFADIYGVPVVILANENHEAVQHHLAVVRGKKPLVIVPVNNGNFGEGFMDSFPIGTQFVERGDTQAHTDQIVREFLKRRR